MACRCRKNATPPAVQALQAGAQVYHEVWLDGAFTGKRFTSIIMAQAYAAEIDGEVRASA
jgi:hypothetical protein